MSINTAFTGTVPDNYDKFLGPVLFEPYAEDLTQRMTHDYLHRVLELACGTGRVTKHLYQLLPTDATLIATDLNQDMLDIAKEKVQSPGVHWQVVDAQELPFDAASFDHVVCQFGVMFFPDKLKAFTEIFRVLRQKGIFLFNTWDSYEHSPISYTVNEVIKEVSHGTSNDFMQNVPHSFYDEAEIRRLLTATGFNSITIDIVPKTSYYANVDYMLNGFLRGTPIYNFLENQPVVTRDEIEKTLRERIISRFGPGRIEVSMQALVVKAVKDKELTDREA